MRRRLVIGTIAVVLVVLGVLVPTTVVLLHRAAQRELEVRLSSQAAAISAAIADDLLQGQLPTAEQLDQVVPAGDVLVILDETGDEVFRTGASPASATAAEAPGPGGTTVVIYASGSALDRRVRGPLVLLGAFVVLAIALAVGLALLIGRRLARPLEQLADAAGRLGGGDFSAAVPPPSGVAEIDRIGGALDASAHRLDQMLIAERSFTGDATHQLRTGLAGIALQLDLLAGHPDDEVRDTVDQTRVQVERLTAGLDELLDLARGAAGQRVELDLAPLVEHHVGDWRRRAAAVGRRIDLVAQPAVVRATPGFVGQAVDILLDNALTHGRGLVLVQVGPSGVTVSDEGSVGGPDDGPSGSGSSSAPGPDVASRLFASVVPPTASHGRGLALARRMARADGGRLELVRAAPTTFVLAYPGGWSGAP
ncbi:MAG: HAMP domain-containing sensor histidine kinase [Acidimicrobiales bacterium]